MSPVQMTDAMLEAGIDALEEVAGVSYTRALAEAVYTAMEAARQRGKGGVDMLARVHADEAILPAPCKFTDSIHRGEAVIPCDL